LLLEEPRTIFPVGVPVAEVSAETTDSLSRLQLLSFAVILLLWLLGDYDGEADNEYDQELPSVGVWLLRLGLV